MAACLVASQMRQGYVKWRNVEIVESSTNGGQKYVLRNKRRLRPWDQPQDLGIWLTFKTHYRPHKRPTSTFQYFIPLPFKRLLSIIASPETMKLNSGWGHLLDFWRRGILALWIVNNRTTWKHSVCVASHGINRWTLVQICTGNTGPRKGWGSRLSSLPGPHSNKVAQASKTPYLHGFSPVTPTSSHSHSHGCGEALNCAIVLQWGYISARMAVWLLLWWASVGEIVWHFHFFNTLHEAAKKPPTTTDWRSNKIMTEQGREY